MQVLYIFIFFFLKLIVLICIYATVLLLIFRLVGKIRPNSWMYRISAKNKRFWLKVAGIAGLFLVTFSKTHWGDHGMGDSSRIPLKHGREIVEVNTRAYISESDYPYGLLEIGNFEITDEFVFTFTTSCTEDSPDDFVIWNLESNEVKFIESYHDYLAITEKYNLPDVSEYKSYRENFVDHWLRWRFWVFL
jgi:hypothetical protein